MHQCVCRPLHSPTCNTHKTIFVIFNEHFTQPHIFTNHTKKKKEKKNGQEVHLERKTNKQTNKQKTKQSMPNPERLRQEDHCEFQSTGHSVVSQIPGYPGLCIETLSQNRKQSQFLNISGKLLLILIDRALHKA